MPNLYNSVSDLVSVENEIVRGVAHRGFSSEAPENTLPAYKLAAKKGFKYVECDICWSSDNVPVLSHDGTIDRCSDGSGTIANMTLFELKTYDFGSWKSSEYAGTQIPTFEEFVSLCRKLGLHPYLDLRDMTSERFQILYDIYSAYGMVGNVDWIAGESWLATVASIDPYARLGYLLSSAVDSAKVNALKALKNDTNSIYFDIEYSYASSSVCELCRSNGIPLEVWTVDSESTIIGLNGYITGVTSNSLHAGRVLYASVD